MSEVRLQVKNLCKNFGITKAVQNVSFYVIYFLVITRFSTAAVIGTSAVTDAFSISTE